MLWTLVGVTAPHTHRTARPKHMSSIDSLLIIAVKRSTRTPQQQRHPAQPKRSLLMFHSTSHIKAVFLLVFVSLEYIYILTLQPVSLFRQFLFIFLFVYVHQYVHSVGRNFSTLAKFIPGTWKYIISCTYSSRYVEQAEVFGAIGMCVQLKLMKQVQQWVRVIRVSVGTAVVCVLGEYVYLQVRISCGNTYVLLAVVFSSIYVCKHIRSRVHAVRTSDGAVRAYIM